MHCLSHFEVLIKQNLELETEGKKAEDLRACCQDNLVVATRRAGSHDHRHEYAAQGDDHYHRRPILYARENTDRHQKQGGRHHSQQYPDNQSHLGVVVKMQFSGL